MRKLLLGTRYTTGVLAENNVDMSALSLAETADFGIVRIIVDNVYNATTVLKDAGYVHSVTDVLAVAIPNVPGGVNKVLTALTDAGVNVEYMYGLSIDGEEASVVLKTSDVEKAEKVLKEHIKGGKIVTEYTITAAQNV